MRNIQAGMVIGVSRDSFPSMIAIDEDATPIVNVPEMPSRSSRPPPLDFELVAARDSDEATTLRLVAPSPQIARALASQAEKSWIPQAVRFARIGAACAAAVALAVAIGHRVSRAPVAAAGPPFVQMAAPAAPPVALAMAPIAVQSVRSTIASAASAPTAKSAPPPAAPAPVAPFASAKPSAPMAADSARPRVDTAHDALAHGRYETARAGYEAVLARDPSNVEAIAGLGDIARTEGDRARAASLYARALTVSPNYAPARVGAADLKWDAGDRAGAIADYRAIVEMAPRVPDYVKARIATGP